MSQPLANKTVAFLATNGVEERELSKPWESLKAAGAKVVLVSLEEGEIQGEVNSEKTKKFKVNQLVSEADADEFDALVLPGGLGNPDKLRADPDAVQFVKDFVAAKKPVAAICHGPWLLIEAGAVKGRTMTSYHSIKTDMKNAGAKWVDEEVVVDHNFVTSRKPDDLAAFCEKTIELIAGTPIKRSSAA